MDIQWHMQTLYITQPSTASIEELFAYFHIGRKMRYQYYQEQRLCINGICKKQNSPITPADVITIDCHSTKTKESCHPCFDGIDILYEDALFLIVNKPVHMLVHSDGTCGKTVLYDLVKGYYMQHDITCPVRAIHRLDEDTTGAILFCKIPFLLPLLDAMLRQKKIHRIYRAVCYGRIQDTEITIDKPIGHDRHHATRMRVSTTGKEARTDVRVLQVYQDYTYIECRLQQGRTHQIRVHLASIKHPLLHDTLYGNQDKRIKRCALHAYCLHFYHPLQQQMLHVHCPMPNDIKQLL